MQNWKYKVLNRLLDVGSQTWYWWDNKSDGRDIEQRINEWGEGGWELVKVVKIERDGNTVEVQLFLKYPF